jgi:hypothetical protein
VDANKILDHTERIVKGQPKTDGMMRTLAGAALCAAVYAAGAIQIPTNTSLVASREVGSVKSVKPDHDDFDCLPSRLINHPSGARALPPCSGHGICGYAACGSVAGVRVLS